jgi:hypothetical protein
MHETDYTEYLAKAKQLYELNKKLLERSYEARAQDGEAVSAAASAEAAGKKIMELQEELKQELFAGLDIPANEYSWADKGFQVLFDQGVLYISYKQKRASEGKKAVRTARLKIRWNRMDKITDTDARIVAQVLRNMRKAGFDIAAYISYFIKNYRNIDMAELAAVMSALTKALHDPQIMLNVEYRKVEGKDTIIEFARGKTEILLPVLQLFWLEKGIDVVAVSHTSVEAARAYSLLVKAGAVELREIGLVCLHWLFQVEKNRHGINMCF